MNFATQMQEKLKDIYDNNIISDRKRDKAKALAAAMCNGAIDGFVIMYPVVFAALVVADCKLKRK